jgi:hypothetical protein
VGAAEEVHVVGVDQSKRKEKGIRGRSVKFETMWNLERIEKYASMRALLKKPHSRIQCISSMAVHLAELC